MGLMVPPYYFICVRRAINRNAEQRPEKWITQRYLGGCGKSLVSALVHPIGETAQPYTKIMGSTIVSLPDNLTCINSSVTKSLVVSARSGYLK